MTTQKDRETEQKADVFSFTKNQILSAKRYIHNKDVVNVVLKDGQTYTLDEVDDHIQNFMKEKVN